MHFTREQTIISNKKIEKERERERYIYIYIEREKERLRGKKIQIRHITSDLASCIAPLLFAAHVSASRFAAPIEAPIWVFGWSLH